MRAGIRVLDLCGTSSVLTGFGGTGVTDSELALAYGACLEVLGGETDSGLRIFGADPALIERGRAAYLAGAADSVDTVREGSC